jgi:hypothetical protein
MFMTRQPSYRSIPAANLLFGCNATVEQAWVHNLFARWRIALPDSM